MTEVAVCISVLGAIISISSAVICFFEYRRGGRK
nr:MAG TPA: Vpu protein [Caudoviricetes sp.]